MQIEINLSEPGFAGGFGLRPAGCGGDPGASCGAHAAAAGFHG